MARSGELPGDSGGELCPLPRGSTWERQGRPTNASSGRSLSRLRRSPLVRKTGLARRSLRVLGRADQGTARSPLRKVSKKRQRLNRHRVAALEEAWGPKEAWRCKFFAFANDATISEHLARSIRTSAGPCLGFVSAHEVLKRSRGGSITDPKNCTPLCAHHNVWVEDEPAYAEAIGLSVPSWA